MVNSCAGPQALHNIKGLTMKLEMRVFNLDVCLELDDDQYYDQLEVLENVKSLVRSLEHFESVYLHIETVKENSQEETETVDEVVVDSDGYRFSGDQTVAIAERVAA